MEWSATGQYLASCSRDKTVWIWETDPETLEEFDCVAVLNDHDQDVKNVCWHPVRNVLASSSYDDKVRIYAQDDDDDEWSCVGILDGHEGTVWCSKFEDPRSPRAKDGRMRLCSVSDDLSVRVWSSESELESKERSLPSSIRNQREMKWEQELVLPGVHTYPIYSVAWSAKTGKIASAGSDGKIVIYKEEEEEGGWKIESVYESSHGVHEINCIIWANLDGEEILVSGGDDGCVNFWKID